VQRHKQIFGRFSAEPGRRADVVALRGEVTSFDCLDERIAWVRKDGHLVLAGD